MESEDGVSNIPQYVTEGMSGRCSFLNQYKRHAWVLPQSIYLRLDRRHRKNGDCGNHFLRFRCNDPECDALMDIAERDLSNLLNLCPSLR